MKPGYREIRTAGLFDRNTQGQTIVYPYSIWGRGYLVPDIETTKKIFLRLYLLPETISCIVGLSYFFALMIFNANLLLNLFALLFLGWVVLFCIATYSVTRSLVKASDRPSQTFLCQHLPIKYLEQELFRYCAAIPIFLWLVLYFPFCLMYVNVVVVSLPLLIFGISKVIIIYKAIRIKRKTGGTEADPFITQLLEETTEVGKKARIYLVVMIVFFIIFVFLGVTLSSPSIKP